MSNWTAEDVRRHEAKRAIAQNVKTSRLKYGNTKTVVDNISFDSKKEAQHYQLLKMRERAGQIDALEVHPKFEIYIDTPDRGRIQCAIYTADFRYFETISSEDGHGKDLSLRVEDVKSKATKTTDYQLRKKLVEAIYDLIITEI